MIPVAVLHILMDVIDGSLQSASPCPPELFIMAQGTLILETSRDLVIPACQSRALWTGFTTCYAEHRIPETVMVETGLLQLFLKCRSAAYRRSVALKKRRILA
ncbi:MAG: hypothetical protein MUO88_22775 [Desulfobacterales bacterium]|nr:hypothetical protein [Desulfobacterales bacterium]